MNSYIINGNIIVLIRCCALISRDYAKNDFFPMTCNIVQRGILMNVIASCFLFWFDRYMKKKTEGICKPQETG